MKGLQDLYIVVLSKLHQFFTFTQQSTTLDPCTHHQLFSYLPTKKSYASNNQNVQQRLFPVQLWLQLRLRLWLFFRERLQRDQLRYQLPGTITSITTFVNARLTEAGQSLLLSRLRLQCLQLQLLPLFQHVSQFFTCSNREHHTNRIFQRWELLLLQPQRLRLLQRRQRRQQVLLWQGYISIPAYINQERTEHVTARKRRTARDHETGPKRQGSSK